MNEINAHLRVFIWRLLTESDFVDEQGNPRILKDFPREHARGASKLKKLIHDGVKVLVHKDGARTEVLLKDYSPGPGETTEQLLNFDSLPELDAPMKAALKYFYNTKHTLPCVSTQTAEQVYDAAERLFA